MMKAVESLPYVSHLLKPALFAYLVRKHVYSVLTAQQIHVGDNGSGTDIYREFCPKCGSYICEYGVRMLEFYDLKLSDRVVTGASEARYQIYHGRVS
jgi:hypothetical protein